MALSAGYTKANMGSRFAGALAARLYAITDATRPSILCNCLTFLTFQWPAGSDVRGGVQDVGAASL